MIKVFLLNAEFGFLLHVSLGNCEHPLIIFISHYAVLLSLFAIVLMFDHSLVQYCFADIGVDRGEDIDCCCFVASVIVN